MQPVRQFGEVLVTMGVDHERVQPIGGISTFTRGTQALDGLPVSPVDRWYDPAPDAGVAGSPEHRAPVVVERTVVEVRVRIYQIEHVSQRPVGL